MLGSEPRMAPLSYGKTDRGGLLGSFGGTSEGGGNPRHRGVGFIKYTIALCLGLGGRSELLVRAGFQNVYNVTDGFEG